MRIFYFFGLLLITCLEANAQNFLYSSDQNIDTVLVADDEFSSVIFVLSFLEEDVTEDVTYHYNVLERTIPKETEFPFYTWYNQLCDPTLCYADDESPDYTVEYHRSPEQLQNQDWGYIQLTLHPWGQPGIGKYEFELYKNNDPSVKDTLTWIFHVEEENTTSVFDAQSELAGQVNVFPNPSIENAFVENAANINWNAKLVTVSGQILKEFEISALQTLQLPNVANTTENNYYLILEDDQGRKVIKEIVKF